MPFVCLSDNQFIRYIEMLVSDIEHFRDLLLERRQKLTDWLNSPVVAHRDDARKVQLLLAEIKDALDRIEDESYGICETCHGEVELYRLEV